eukprot:8554423-Karenia_brevis.AAC.1
MQCHTVDNDMLMNTHAMFKEYCRRGRPLDGLRDPLAAANGLTQLRSSKNESLTTMPTTEETASHFLNITIFSLHTFW